MPKLRLDLEDVRVESFEVLSVWGRVGTVNAHAPGDEGGAFGEPVAAVETLEYLASCFGTCEASCQTLQCGTCPRTCKVSCNGGCYYTVDAECSAVDCMY